MQRGALQEHPWHDKVQIHQERRKETHQLQQSHQANPRHCHCKHEEKNNNARSKSEDANNKHSNNRGCNNKPSKGRAENGNLGIKLCRHPRHDHKWGDCPNNPCNKNIKKENKKTKDDKSKPEANLTEQNCTVLFDNNTGEIIIADKDWDDDSYASLAGLKESFSTESDKQVDQNKPHPSTIFPIPLEPGSKQKIYVAGLVDQCATGTRLISCCVANKLGFIQQSIKPKTYLITARESQCHEEVTIIGITLPKIMQSKHFTASLKVMDQHMPYVMLLGQGMQQAIKLHTNVINQFFMWDDTAASMRPHNYYTPKRICMFKTAYLLKVRNHKQAALASSTTPPPVIKPNSMGEKQPCIDITTTSSGEPIQGVFKTETGLKQATYEKHNLQAIVPKKCAHLTVSTEQLLSILEEQAAIFKGKQGQWTGGKVKVERKPDAKPIRCKPYPISLKNQEATKHEVFQQCNIGRLGLSCFWGTH